MTIQEMYPFWIQDKTVTVKWSTVIVYKNVYSTHIANHPITQKEINSINKYDLINFITEYQNKGISDTTIKQMYAILKNIMNFYWDENGELRKVLRFKFPKSQARTRSQKRLPSERECALIANTLLTDTKPDSINMRTALVILMFTGMRCGEVLGLQWKDIDLLNGVIHVNKAFYTINDREENSLVSKIATPKTNSSVRDIPINNELRYYLTSRIPEDKELYVASGRNKPSFAQSLRRSFSNICKKANIEPFNLHTWRHQFATKMLQVANPVTVSYLLGHSDPGITLKIYGHSNMDMMRGAVANLYSGILH